MITIDKAVIHDIEIHSDNLQGTSEYNKYYMCMESKFYGKKNFTFICWGIPHSYDDYYLKRYKDNVYIMREELDGDIDRWLVNESVMAILINHGINI